MCSQLLLEVLVPLIPYRRTKSDVVVATKVLGVIWFLANQETYRSVADRFGVSKVKFNYLLSVVIGCLLLMLGTCQSSCRCVGIDPPQNDSGFNPK